MGAKKREGRTVKLLDQRRVSRSRIGRESWGGWTGTVRKKKKWRKNPQGVTGAEGEASMSKRTTSKDIHEQRDYLRTCNVKEKTNQPRWHKKVNWLKGCSNSTVKSLGEAGGGIESRCHGVTRGGESAGPTGRPRGETCGLGKKKGKKKKGQQYQKK